MKTKEPKAPWVMPPWMERYREHFENTGGNPIEELMNDDDSSMQNNYVRFILIISVRSQVTLLNRMHRSGLVT